MLVLSDLLAHLYISEKLIIIEDGKTIMDDRQLSVWCDLTPEQKSREVKGLYINEAGEKIVIEI